MNERTSVVSLCNLIKEALWRDGIGRNSYFVSLPLCSNPLQLFLSSLIAIFVQLYACYCVCHVGFVWPFRNKHV